MRDKGVQRLAELLDEVPLGASGTRCSSNITNPGEISYEFGPAEQVRA